MAMQIAPVSPLAPFGRVNVPDPGVSGDPGAGAARRLL